MRRSKSRSLTAVIGLSASLTGLQAFADEPDQVSVQEPVIVQGKFLANEKFSGTKTPTPLIDVPQSVSLLTEAELVQQAFDSIGDILRYTPGTSVGQGEGHRDQITIRGQNTTADFFIDGLRDDVQYYRPLYNLRQVEILRGANAMIFGRGGGGGVINRVTKTPQTDEAFTAGSLAIDTFGDTTITADINRPVSDTSAFRLNAFYQSLANHRDAFEGDRYGVSPTFQTELGPRTQLLFSYEYLRDDRVVDRGVPSSNGRPLEGYDDTFFGSPEANVTTLDANIARMRLDHSFTDDLAMNVTVQYADYDKLYQNLYPDGFDAAAGTVTLDGYRDTTDRQNLIVQGNLIGRVTTGPLDHLFLFGAEYGDQQTANDRRDSFFTDSSDDRITFIFSDPLAIPAFSFPDLVRETQSEVTFTSIYAQDQIDIGDTVKLVLGLRYDSFDISVGDLVEVRDGSADGNDGRLSRKDDEISPRVGVIWKPAEDTSFYVSYSESFLPRSGDQFLSLSPSTEALGPERFENIEAGVKWDINDRLNLTAAIFRLERDAGTTVDPNDSSRTILIGSLTEGLEFQLAGQITDAWYINAGYSYLDGQEDGRVIGGAEANRTLAQVPEHMFSIWNRYAFSERLAVGVGATYQSEQFATISNAVTLPDYTRVDAALYYDLSERVQIQLNVENLFNTYYFPDAHSDNNISTGAPTSLRLRIAGRF